MAYASASRDCKEAALGSESSPSWHLRTSLAFGPGAPALSDEQTTGFSLYVVAAQALLAYGESLEVVAGSVTDRAERVSVVVCPVLRCLRDLQIGAQHAIRKAAGKPLEDFIAATVAARRTIYSSAELRDRRGILEEGEALLAPGGALAPHVLLIPTEIDWGLGALAQLHRRVFAAVRGAGFRSLVMPTLCTGGQGVPAEIVVKVLASVVAEDLIAHRGDPLKVRVACFDARHVFLLREAKVREGRAALFAESRPAEDDEIDLVNKRIWTFGAGELGR